MPAQPLLLVCSKGPKSLVALDYLAERCPRAVAVEGGITAWDAAVLPTEEVGIAAVLEWAMRAAAEARSAARPPSGGAKGAKEGADDEQSEGD